MSKEKQLSEIQAKLTKLASVCEEMQATLNVLVVSVNSLDAKFDGTLPTGRDKKTATKRRIDIVGFVKGEYIKDQSFFKNHISEESRIAIISKIPTPKKQPSLDDRLKKEASELWKKIKELDQQKYYSELKSKLIVEPNPDLPAAEAAKGPDEELLHDSDSGHGSDFDA